MTDQEELRYLSLLCLEAARWKVSESEELCPLELEIKDRLARLTGGKSINVEGVPSTEIEEAQEDSKEAPKPKPKSRRSTFWTRRKSQTHVRIKENGHTIWIPREEAEKVPARNGKWKWSRRTEITQ
jgi:hypothetical protein